MKYNYKYQYTLDEIKEELISIMNKSEYLKQTAKTIEEKKLAENIVYAIDNALDIAKP